MGWLSGKLNNGRHASMRVSNPRARTEDLVIEDLDGEVLVYDSRTARAHCLTGAAAQVWRAADGTLAAHDLSESLGLDSDDIAHALAVLEENDLLDAGSMPVVTPNRADGGEGP